MTGLSNLHRRVAMLGLAQVTFFASPVSSFAGVDRIEPSVLLRVPLGADTRIGRDRVLAREVDTKNRVKGSRAFWGDLDRREFSQPHEMLPGARVMGRKTAVDVTVAEEGDIPVAGDFRMGPGPAGLVRYYFVVDRQGSVLGLVDEGGAWVERVRYDVWGTPVFEAADVMAPEVSRVGTDPGTGDVVIVMSEPVVPRAVLPTAPNQNVALEAIDLSSEVYFEDALGQEVPGQIVVDLDAVDEPGVPVGSVLRFIPDSTVLAGTQLVLRLNQSALVDDGNLGNADTSLAVTYGAGVSYTGPPAGSTQPVLQAQSLTGNRLLFQSHFWDADVGLYHMRARMFDPRSGTFLSRDPSGYVDSVNLYAPMKWDVVNHRDPSGRETDPAAMSEIGRLQSKVDAAKRYRELYNALPTDDPMRPLIAAWLATAVAGAGIVAIETFPVLGTFAQALGWTAAAGQVANDEDADLSGLVAMASGTAVSKAIQNYAAMRNAPLSRAIAEPLERPVAPNPAPPPPTATPVVDDALYARGTWRQSTIKDAEAASKAANEGRLRCATCGTDVSGKITIQTQKGLVLRRAYDLDHFPTTWAQRIKAMQCRAEPPSRKEVLDVFNADVRLQCPACNQGHCFEGIVGDYQ